MWVRYRHNHRTGFWHLSVDDAGTRPSCTLPVSPSALLVAIQQEQPSPHNTCRHCQWIALNRSIDDALGIRTKD